MRHFLPKGLRIVAILGLGFVAFAFVAHLILNTKTFQDYAARIVEKIIPIDMEWEKLKFNGATGRFYGDNLKVRFPKVNTEVSLEHFNLIFDPIRLLFKQIRLVDLEAKGLRLMSRKVDVFSDQIRINGSINFEESSGFSLPNIRGDVTLQGLLFGLNKTPIPWNDAPGWEESLNPVIHKYYPIIPENRTFAYLDKINLPITFKKNKFEIDHASILGMGGVLSLHGHWSPHSTDLFLKTEEPLTLALLPLGKARFRHSFKKVHLELSAQGKFPSLSENDLEGDLKLELVGNPYAPTPASVQLLIKPSMTHGILKLPNLQILLGDGLLKGSGKIDFLQKKMEGQFDGEKLDAQTIIHFFSSIDIVAEASAQGEIHGNFKNPEFDFSLKSESAAYESLRFGSFDGSLEIKNQSLLLKGVTNLAGIGTGNLNLKIQEIFRSSKQTLDLESSFKNLPIEELLKTETLTGHVDGSFKMHKDKENYDGSGQISVRDAHWLTIPIDQASTTLTLKDRELKLSPISITWNSDVGTTTISKPFVFQFGPEGYEFKGWALPSLELNGRFLKERPEELVLNFKAKDTSLLFLKPILPIDPKSFSISGDLEMTYNIPQPLDSSFKASALKFDFQADEKRISLQIPKIDYEKKRFVLDHAKAQIGSGQLFLNGPISMDDESELEIKGDLDLGQLVGLQPWVTDSSGKIKISTIWKGSLTEPRFFGSFVFDQTTFLFPALGREISNLKGTLEVQDKKLACQCRLLFEDAPLNLSGWVEWKSRTELAGAQLRIKGEEISFFKADTWRLLADADVVLQGQGSGIRLSGKMGLVDGLYFKDYSLTQFVLKPLGVNYVGNERTFPAFLNTVILDLRLKGAGDFIVKNNLADLVLKSDLLLKGTMERPMVTGTVDVLEGEIHAMGIDFEDARGYLTFTGNPDLNPEVEFIANHEIQDYEIKTKVSGLLDNLRLNLESTPALSHKDIISLIAYGRTPDQLSASSRNLFSTSAIASQVVGALQRPISKATRLDIVKLESEFDPNSPDISRFSIGKQLSDRFSLAFTTDLSLDESFKGVVVEYLMLDSLLLKSTKDTGSRYRFDLTWRLESH